MSHPRVLSRRRSDIRRVFPFIIGAVYFAVGALAGLRGFAQQRPNFADAGASAAPVISAIDVRRIVAPFHDQCQRTDEFEERRCRASNPQLRQSLADGLWRVDLNGGELVSISRYDFALHRFDVFVRNLIWEGSSEGMVNADRPGYFLATFNPRTTLQRPPLLYRHQVVIEDTTAAEAWRNRNRPQSLVLSLLFRVGAPWTDVADPNGMSPRTRFGLLIVPSAIQVRNIDTGEILVEVILSGGSPRSEPTSIADAGASNGGALRASATNPSLDDAGASGATSSSDAAGAQLVTGTFVADAGTPVRINDCPVGSLRIPGGSFRMGLPDNAGSNDEHPQHSVRLGSFCMDQTEVTVASYRACVATQSCTAPDTDEVEEGCNWPRHDRDSSPVNCVDWTQASAYCRWVGGRLPTEAEWEYAARGSDGRMYPWGNADPDGRICVGRNRTCAIGSFPTGDTPLGLHDMAGNVWEWTADWYAPYRQSSDPQVDPTGPAEGSSRVFRGGGYEGSPYVRASSRRGELPSFRGAILGFRCARLPRAPDR